MARAYCPKCEEIRTDTGEDAWGFMWHAAAAQCQRCGAIIELRDQAEEDVIDDAYEEEAEEE